MSQQRMSAAEYRARVTHAQTGPVGKYGNKRVREDGHTFGSKGEHARYCDLKLLLRGGKITELRVHTRFPLDVNGRRIGTYEDDFDYRENGKLVIEDTKGVVREDYRLKRELMIALYPDAEFRELKL